MKYVILAIVAFTIVMVVAYLMLVHGALPSLHPTIRAIYFSNGQGELDQGELRRHPEVIVTSSFDELKEYAKWRVALWVDKNLVHKITDEERSWFKSPPQAYYPVAVVGYGDKSTAFKILIPLHCIPESPCSSFLAGELYSGCSIYQKDPDQESPNIWEGYTYKCRVQDILDITDRLLDRNNR